MALTIPSRNQGDKITPAIWNEVITGVNGESVALDVVEARTTDVSGNVGIGNQRLSDRLGSGVDNTTNVTTGTATAQLTNLRTRVGTLETSGSPAARPSVEYRLTGAPSQLIGQNSRIIWNSAVETHAAITYNSTTGLFTCVAAGWYSGFASVRVDTSSEIYLWIATGTTATGTTRSKAGSLTSVNLAVPFRFKATAGLQFGFYGWVASAVSATAKYTVETAGDSVPVCQITYDGT